MALTEVNLYRIDGDLGSISNVQTSALNGGPLAGTRNRIINGDMRIDQRNAGASVNQDTSGIYTVDRWLAYGTVTSKFTIQRSTTAPANFNNSALLTSSSAYSVTSSDQFVFYQSIEGFNSADFAWGTANASTVTFSFWVRSSLTGTMGGSVRNGAFNRSYPFSFTISAANTWEKKTITISGDTSGTWSTDNSAGLLIGFCLGAGSSLLTTSGAWTAGNYVGPTGATSVVGTNGATFYITGVQLEPGTVATPFERRSYGQELALCQRYYQTGRAGYRETYPKNGAGVYWYGDYLAMRAAPTGAITSTAQNDSNRLGSIAVSSTSVSTIVFSATVNGSTGDPVWGEVNYSVSSEL